MSNPFPDDDFASASAVRTYCNNVRNATHRMAVELSLAADELKAALVEVPGNNLMFGVDSKYRARQVSKHLEHAAESMAAVAAGAVRTYAAFKRHYAPELAIANGRKPKPRRQFDFED